MARAVSKEPLKAYDAKNNIIGMSYDGGKTWSSKPQPPPNQPYQTYTRHIAAVMPEDGVTPNFYRRIANNFAPLKDAEILTSWGTVQNILDYKSDTIGAIVLSIPDTQIPVQEIEDLITRIRSKAPIFIVDMGDRPIHNPAHLEMAIAFAAQADAILVPSDRIGLALRKHNPNTYTVPSTVDPQHWKDYRRVPRAGSLRIAVQPHDNRFITDALEYVKERYPAYNLEIFEDRWFERIPAQDAIFYSEVDVVIVGAPNNPTYSVNTPLLGPMSAGCAVVADVVYNKTIIHGHSGVLIAKPGPGMWRQELTHIITDRGYRLKMQKGGKERSRLFQNRVNLSRLALPYRVLVPAQEIKIG
jgi:hypothetical protein